MGKAMSNDTSTIIVRALAQGYSRGDIAKMCGVSTRAVTRVSTNLKKHGSAKPPPSGLKQGRPARLTRKQADALLVWITARNYTFYVKDLVKYLREHHDYRGCDGTVRRGMVRAGFKRKEPYHKSEITVWIPPDHSPHFEIIAADEPQASTEKHPFDSQQQPQQQGLQPLEQATSQPPMQAPPAPMTADTTDPASMLDSYSNYYHQHHEPFQAQASIPQLDPNLYQMDSAHTSGQSTQQQSQMASRPEIATAQQQAVKSPPKKARKPRKEEQLQDQVSLMHEEMIKQAEMIRQLQMQLAQSQPQDQPQGPMPPLPLSAPGIDPSLEQHGQQQHEGNFQTNEEEMAV